MSLLNGRFGGSRPGDHYHSAMKAAVHIRYGPPEVVRIIDVNKPVPTGNQVLIRVHATTVNRTDCHYRAAKPFVMRFLSGLTKPKATILGTEFAGEVAALGPEASSFQVGDRVFGYNEGPFGAHAEFMVMPESGLVAAMPANLAYDEAAPGTEGSHYALAHIQRAKITSGQVVLVYGATGAIGSAAVQLLKSYGVRVTAVCGAAHVALAHGLSDGDRLQHLRGVLPCPVRVTASAHPLFGELLAASAFRRFGGVMHLVVELPDGSPGTIRADATDVLAAAASQVPGTVLDAVGVRALKALVTAMGDAGSPRQRRRSSK